MDTARRFSVTSAPSPAALIIWVSSTRSDGEVATSTAPDSSTCEPFTVIARLILPIFADRRTDVLTGGVTVYLAFEEAHMTTPSYVSGTSEKPLLGDTIGGNLDRVVAAFGDREALVEY